MSFKRRQMPIPALPCPLGSQSPITRNRTMVSEDDELESDRQFVEYKEKSLYKLQLAPPDNTQDDDFYNDLLPQPTPTSVPHQNQYVNRKLSKP